MAVKVTFEVGDDGLTTDELEDELIEFLQTDSAHTGVKITVEKIK